MAYSTNIAQPCLKRCSTHHHIARNIHFHQEFTKMNKIWPAKPHNANAVPSMGSQKKITEGAMAYSMNDETGKQPTANDLTKEFCEGKKMNRPSWTKESSFLTDDGYSWRKYGEKIILNCLYPRNYFRCIHKCDQGCLATKQVQRLATVSPKYRITYFGHHTCRNILKDEEIISTYPGPREEDGILLSFERPRIERNTTDSDILLSFKLPKPKIIRPKIESNTRGSDFLPFKGPKVGPIQRFPLNINDSDPCASYIATANSKISGNNNQHFLGSNQESAEEDSVGPIGNDPYVELNMGKDLRSFVSPETSMSSDYGTAVYSSSASKSSSTNSGAGPIDFDAGFYFHI